MARECEPRVTSTRSGPSVIIAIRCADTYQAILLHDQIVRDAAEKGRVLIEVRGGDLSRDMAGEPAT